MTSIYTLRVTIAVPEAHIPDANQLAVCLGNSAADVGTFGSAKFQDGSGNLYSVASTLATDVFPVAAASQLVAPAFAPDVDLVAAGRAQALIVTHTPNPETEAPQASPDKIIAIIHDKAMEAVDMMGLSRVQ